MEGGKRKWQPLYEEKNQEIDDEEKIEKFFEIIKRFQDAHKSTNGLLELKEASCSLKKDKGQEAVWVPSFEWEDFLEQGFKKEKCLFQTEVVGHAIVNLNSSTKGMQEEEGKKEDEGNGLDLNLTL
ncbi:hypothetical protein LOK49_LG02G02376 [Camellia lanceoleosa]|uniref:Uncharacterized protein n=1 Tax=Camellia lanceoleosa TaxID=1840588 RepID=A0ACC0IX02_9ERIC|nr:hypothetical protein LOK49_LG02G02376 [Camellia lanceoleosa]